jgi:rhodanese-related sulfurtransferase
MSQTMDDVRIEPRDAARRVASGEAFLLDVVTEGAWRSLARVPKGALRIPPEEISDRWDEIPRGRAAIAFCT